MYDIRFCFEPAGHCRGTGSKPHISRTLKKRQGFLMAIRDNAAIVEELRLRSQSRFENVTQLLEQLDGDGGETLLPGSVCVVTRENRRARSNRSSI
jgi:hypothetical protein